MIVPHLVAAAWGGLIVAGLVDCPLTWAEDWARRRAGQGGLAEGFVDRYLEGVIYPPQYLNEARLAVTLVIAVSWIGAYALWRRRRKARPEVDTADTRAKSDTPDGRAAT